MVKLNNSDNYEPITITLSKEQFPIAFEKKVNELMKQGISKEEAEKIASKPIDLEVYYSEDCGLFAVESEAVESGTIYDPYTGELCEEADEY